MYLKMLRSFAVVLPMTAAVLFNTGAQADNFGEEFHSAINRAAQENAVFVLNDPAFKRLQQASTADDFPTALKEVVVPYAQGIIASKYYQINTIWFSIVEQLAVLAR